MKIHDFRCERFGYTVLCTSKTAKVKMKKPLIYKGFRVVVATGLEPVTPSMWTMCSGSQVKTYQRGSDENIAERLHLLAFLASLFIRKSRRETWWVGSKHRWTHFEPRVQGGFKHEVGSTGKADVPADFGTKWGNPQRARWAEKGLIYEDFRL